MNTHYKNHSRLFLSLVILFLLAIMLIPSNAPTLAQTSCPADMLAYWQLNETGSPTSFLDAYDGHDGGCAGACPTPAAGHVNGAQQFSRAGTTGIDIPAHSEFDWGRDASFSIEYWMKGEAGVTCAGSATGDNEVIVGRDDASTQLHIWTGCSATGGGVAAWQLRDTSYNGVQIEGTTPINDGKWHHVVVMRNGGTDTNSIYVDGDLEASTIFDEYANGFGSGTAAFNIGWLNLNPDYHYTGLLDEVAIYNRALSEQEIRNHYYLARGYCDGCSTPITMMPLGDSITYDNFSGDTRPVGERIAYRLPLWEFLIDGGYSIDFVGNVIAGQDMGQALVPPFDPNNEGHPGWRDDEIAANVYDWLGDNPAEVVLLHIGTNGLDSSPDDVEDILDEIDRWEEADTGNQVTVVLARIINRSSYSSTTTTFNNNVEAMALARMDPTSPDYTGDEIIIVDLEDGVGINYSEDTTYPYDDGDMWDGLHPNDSGYGKMASGWYNGDSAGSLGLVDFLPLCAPPTPQAPTITSAAVTDAYIGVPYTYDVAANGNPAPTFSLTTAPAGMTIDANSGLISWTPSVTGPADVTVVATNSEGSDPQIFTIDVAEAPAFTLRINSGGPTIVDGATTWEDDAPYVSGGSDFNFGSSSIDTTTNGIAAPVPPLDVLNTVRHYDHTFDIPSVPDGIYTVRIIWTDKFDHDRQMDYDIEGVRVLEDWNIVAAAGGTDIAVEREFEVTVSDGNGMQIEAFKGSGNDVFESAIEIVSLEGSTPTAPTITSTAVTDATVGSPYSYDVAATGNPAPTFSLLVSPAGMTIDANSGLISWPSPTLGDHDVEVQALNSEGSDTQAFVLSVTEAAAFALRINSGGGEVVDGAITWEDDAPYVSGGSDFTFGSSSIDTTTNGITAPVPPFAVLQTVRHFDHTFDIASVPNGSYTVRIIWTDAYGGPRAMDYDIEGVRVLEDWDIVAEAGGTDIAVEREFEVTVSDGDGMQIVASQSTGNDVFESAIEIVSSQDTGILGDVNGDNTVNSTDALIILSCDVGIDTSGFCPCDCGDVNDDTVVNSTDALIILSYDVGISVPYPVGEPGCPSGVTPCPGCNP